VFVALSAVARAGVDAFDQKLARADLGDGGLQRLAARLHSPGDAPTARRFQMSSSLAFMRRGPISPRLHGTLDYALAAALIAGPLVFHFDSNTARVFVLVVGGAASLLAVGTAWSRGIVRVVPPVLHGVADVGATLALIAAPFVLGYSDHTVATVFCVAVGAGGLGATLLTRFESDLEPAAPVLAFAHTAR
jgi:hypothetical protein